jgi:hypothetical protein
MIELNRHEGKTSRLTSSVARQIEKAIAAKPLEIQRISPDLVVVTQMAEHRPISSLISGDWDVPAQDIRIRPFVVNAIRSRHRHIERLTIAVDGTPCRGIVLVKLDGHELTLRTGDESRVLSRLETRLLQFFAEMIHKAAWQDGAE